MIKKLAVTIFLCLITVFSLFAFAACGTDNIGVCKHNNIVNIEMVEPTCEFKGLTTGKRCADCGEIIIEQEPIPALGHNFSDYKITKEPTCTINGNKERTCSRCGYIEKTIIGVSGHKYGNFVTTKEASCFEKGKRTKTCTVCGKQESEDTEIIDHNFVGTACTFCNASKGLAYSYNEYSYNEYNKGYYITGSYYINGMGTCYASDVIIPAYYNKLPVVGIDYGAFSGCNSVTSIILPNSITFIHSNAFTDCSNLTNINVPEKVTLIECSLFDYCSNLANINLPKNVTAIEDYAFRGCRSLTNINIPENVTTIGAGAFADCSNLANINIPKNTTTIGESAFYGCNALTSISVPSSIESIGKRAFADCKNLEKIEVEDGNTIYYSENNCLIVKDYNVLILGCKNSIIPETVTRIEDYAFNCSEVTFNGTTEQWNAITKSDSWNDSSKYTVICTDGNITK